MIKIGIIGVTGAIATALSAEKLIFLSDVDGFYADSKDPTTRVDRACNPLINGAGRY